MSELYVKMKEAFDKVRKETFGALGGARYIPTRSGEDDDNPDNRPDFPYIEDPQQFKTHIPLEQDELTEDEELEPEEEGEETEELPPEGEGEETGELPPPGQDPSMGMPEPEKEEKLTTSQIGRVYELKKIYSRLTSIEMFLSRTTDDSILEIRKYVAQSIDMFELVISNFTQFTEKIDEIIVTYYEFLDNVYGSIRKYFSGISKE